MPNCRICNRPNASRAMPTPLQLNMWVYAVEFGHLGGFGDSSSLNPRGYYYCSYHQKPCPVPSCIERNERGDYCANHKSICQASYCSDRTASDKTYCSKHSKYCSESDCSQRIDNYSDYCSAHKEYDCYKEISQEFLEVINNYEQVITEVDLIKIFGSPDNFSLIRGKICSEPNCNEEIGTCFQCCSDHKKLCQVRGCEKTVDYLGDYCYSHLNVSLKDCNNYNCTNQATSPEIYCRKHQWKCKYVYCSERIPFGSYYCSSHKNVVCQVSYCSNPKSSNGYCSDHYYRCQESGCQRRDKNSYCFDHHNICHEDNCLARISSIEDCCVAHQVRVCQKCTKRIGKPKESNRLLFGRESKDFHERMNNLCSTCATDFLLNTCKELSCEVRINRNEEKHCSNHNNTCSYWYDKDLKNCSARIAFNQSYCSFHNKTCLACSSRSLFSDYYCFHHTNKCANCSTRISYHDRNCSNCLTAKRKKETEQTRLKELVKSNTSIAGTIQEVERFSSWFNPNCATVIAENNNYALYLVVYEPATKAMGKVIVAIKIADKSSLTEAKSKASELRTNLNGENPILAVFADADSYAHINRIITWPYIESNQVGSSVNVVGSVYGPFRHFSPIQQYISTIPTDLDNHFKPLDIVWVKCLESFSGIRFYHVGIVLGNNQICEFSRNGTRITNWQNFLEDTTNKIIRFHPIVPFKKHDKIVRQITWASENNYRKGEYNLLNKNCEHFAKNVC